MKNPNRKHLVNSASHPGNPEFSQIWSHKSRRSSRSFAAWTGLGLIVTLAGLGHNTWAQTPTQEENRRIFENFFRARTQISGRTVQGPGAPEINNYTIQSTENTILNPSNPTLNERLLKYQEYGKKVPATSAEFIPHAPGPYGDAALMELRYKFPRVNLPPSPGGERNEFLANRRFVQVYLWNEVALNMTALDHTALVMDPSNPAPRTHEQFGPPRTARAMAIVHIAMFEALNLISGNKYSSYRLTGTYYGPTPPTMQEVILRNNAIHQPVTLDGASSERAIAQAAYRTLVALYPNYSSYLADVLLECTAQIPDSSEAQLMGELIGNEAADTILNDRTNDGSDLSDPMAASLQTQDPGKWRPDPLNPDLGLVALGGNWWHVRPFVMATADAFRADPPPRPGDPKYDAAFVDVAKYGGDPKADPNLSKKIPGKGERESTPTIRTGATRPSNEKPTAEDETFRGKFWAYDGTAYLCAPPRLYNMVGLTLALRDQKNGSPIKQITDPLELARFLTLLNVTLADAGVSAWDAKYYYLAPRPVTGIRSVTPEQSRVYFGKLPELFAMLDHPISKEDLAKEDKEVALEIKQGLIDPPTPVATRILNFFGKWAPLGGQASNAMAGSVNLSPPFPAYPSGHAVFGGAVFQMFREYWAINPATDGTGKPDTAKGTMVYSHPEATDLNKPPTGAPVDPDTGFTFYSDEYNGVNGDAGPEGTPPRARMEKTFPSLAEAEWENARSRVWLGIHWQFDADTGVDEGRHVGRYVFHHAFQAKN